MKEVAPVVERAIEALDKHGPVPIVSVCAAIFGPAALLAGASPYAVFGVLALAMVGAIYSVERKAALQRRERREEYDMIQHREGRALHQKMRRRIEARERAIEPGLFDGPEGEQ